MLAQARLGDTLMKSMMARKKEKGELSLDDIGAIFQEVASEFQSITGETESVLQTEISKMADYIEKAKGEIVAISRKQGEQLPDGIADATAQLDSVVKSTEEATNSIMDAADEIQAAAAGVGGEAEQKIMDASTRIYEACNFQDITGQQINKVIKVITFLDERLHALTGIVSDAAVAAGANVESSTTDTRADAELMNGPQLEQPSQADIDALFDSFDTGTGG